MGAGVSCSPTTPCAAPLQCGPDNKCGYALGFANCSATAPALACVNPLICDTSTTPPKCIQPPTQAPATNQQQNNPPAINPQNNSPAVNLQQNNLPAINQQQK